MSDIVIYGEWADPSLRSHIHSYANTSYATARAGSGSKAMTTYLRTGQDRTYDSGSRIYTYHVDQCAMEFDLSSIPENALVSAATIALRPVAKYDVASVSPGFEIRAYDFGDGYTVSDFVPGASLASYTLLASVAWAGLITTGYCDFTSEADLLALLADPDARPALFRAVLAGSRQRTADAPTASEYVDWTAVAFTDRPRLTVTVSGWAIGSSVTSQSLVTARSNRMVALVQSGILATCSRLSSAPRSSSSLLRLCDHTGAGLAFFAGTVRVTERLDGSDSIEATVPWQFQRTDGTHMDFGALLAGGWYLVYRDSWYRIDDMSKSPGSNRITLRGLSREVELEKFLSNYSQVPLVMPSHTPSEIMTAMLSGLPEMQWYNGDFALLDDAGFPVGWLPDDAANWTLYANAGGPGLSALIFPNGEAEVESYPIPHTVGASIKLKFDVWVDADFAGSLSATIAYVNEFGVETATTVLAITPTLGDWYTYTQAAFASVRNGRVVLRFRVYGNDGGAEVRFRNVRFLQQEDSTGWTYQGEMDSRSGVVACDDPRWLTYGGWTPGATYITTTSTDDVLALPFTGDAVAVVFPAVASTAEIRVDGAVKVTGLSLAAGVTYSITDLDRYRGHLLEVQMTTGTRIYVTQAALSSEARIAATWNRLSIYNALREMQTIVGGEYWYDTAEKIIHHVAARGNDLTAANILWLREGQNLPEFELTAEMSEIENRIYCGGYGDGAFQIGAKVDATGTEGGSTSQTLYGVQRGTHTDKEKTSLSSLLEDGLSRVEERAFPTRSYRARLSDADASLLQPGDTVLVTHQSLDGGSQTLRCLEVTRSSDATLASVTFGSRPRVNDAARQTQDIKRKVDQLLRAY